MPPARRSDFVVHPAERPLVGSVPVPGDKSIVHRAILFAGIAEGTSRVDVGAGGLGEDNASTLAALAAMGIVTRIEGEAKAQRVLVEGKGLHGLATPATDLDCGNSGTTMRLLSGILAAQRFAARLVGDASLSRRPMERIATPLRLRGARIEGQLDTKKPGRITAPLEIGPLPAPHVLSALEYESPVASAQVKSAIVLSGLYSEGATYVREPIVSRDHTERMLAALGVPIRSIGPVVELDPGAWSGVLPAFEITPPGDLSAAAFLVAAAHLVAGSRVDVRGVGLNPTRTGLLEVLRDMGGRVAAHATTDALGEPIGDVLAEFTELRGVRTGGETVTRAIDEVPILCALAARARGETRIADVAELRVKESDRIATMASVLRAFGVACDEEPDAITIEGRPDGALRAPPPIDSHGDHRIAMTAAVMGLVADGPTVVRDVGCVATSFPRFAGTLRALGARIDVVTEEA